MANVPWHQEVVAFVQQLADMLPQYEIACEHEHSNCLLVAHTKVRAHNTENTREIKESCLDWYQVLTCMPQKIALSVLSLELACYG